VTPAESVLVLGVFWVVVLWALSHQRHQRRLSWTLAACAVAATLDGPMVVAAVDSATGVAAGDSLVKHLVLLYPIRSAVILAEGVAYGGPHARRSLADRITATAPVAAPALVALFAVMPRREAWLNGPRPGSASVPGIAYFAIYLVLFGTAMCSLLLTGRRARSESRNDPHLVATFRCLTVGAVCGVLYVVHKAVSLTCTSVPSLDADGLVRRLHPLGGVFLGGSLLCFAVGSVLPLVTLSSASRGLRRWWLGRRLRPLWALFVEASPHNRASLDVGIATRPERWAIELRDGISAVTPYVPVDAEQRVRTFVESQPAHRWASPLVATAACLELGRRRLIRNEAPTGRTVPVQFDDDTGSLTDLADAYEHGRRIAALLEG